MFAPPKQFSSFGFQVLSSLKQLILKNLKTKKRKIFKSLEILTLVLSLS